MRRYGTTHSEQLGIPRHKSGFSRLVLGIVMAGALAGCVIMSVMVERTTGVTVLSDLDSTYPAALQDIANHVNISEKKSWMREIFAKASATKQLHPLADIDPFTNKPQDGSSYEAMLRHHATKAIVEDMDASVKAEIDAAQQSARDAIGADAGCTHRELDQIDYSGDISAAVTGEACMDWQTAADEGVTSEYTPANYSSLTGAACRNPGGSRLGAWCFLASVNATAMTGAEGETWEYCDIGTRCGIDMPLLKQMNLQQLRMLSKEAKMDPTMTSAQARAAINEKGFYRIKGQVDVMKKEASYISHKQSENELKAAGLI